MKIFKFKEDVLFKKAMAVEEDEFGEELDELMSNMLTTMFSSRGVGLAAPQVGDSRRFLVADIGYVNGQDYGTNTIKMVNPEIISYSEEEGKAKEGCLSYPGLATNVSRPLAIRVKFFSPVGEELEESFNGWPARIIMHEIDHLNGITLYGRSSAFAKSRYDKRVKRMRLI